MTSSRLDLALSDRTTASNLATIGHRVEAALEHAAVLQDDCSGSTHHRDCAAMDLEGLVWWATYGVAIVAGRFGSEVSGCHWLFTRPHLVRGGPFTSVD